MKNSRSPLPDKDKQTNHQLLYWWIDNKNHAGATGFDASCASGVGHKDLRDEPYRLIETNPKP